MIPPRIYATPRQWVMTALMVLLGVLAGFAANVMYTNKVDRESNQAWCEIITGLDKRYQALENPDPDAQEFREQVARLKTKYSC